MLYKVAHPCRVGILDADERRPMPVFFVPARGMKSHRWIPALGSYFPVISLLEASVELLRVIWCISRAYLPRQQHIVRLDGYEVDKRAIPQSRLQPYFQYFVRRTAQLIVV